MADENKVQHIVVDAGGFIRNAPLKDIGVKLYTIAEVVREIRDKATRQRLQVLPYELHFREPSPEAIKMVTDFARKTGDYRSLSAVDIRVMALTYLLEKEHVGTAHIRMTPQPKIEWNSTTKHLEKPTEIAGFYLGKAIPGEQHATSVSQDSGVDADDVAACIRDIDLGKNSLDLDNIVEEANEGKESQPDGSSTHPSTKDSDMVGPADSEEVPPSVDIGAVKPEVDEEYAECEDKENSAVCPTPIYRVSDGDAIPASCVFEVGSDDSEDEEEEEEEEDDDDGWITPGNIKEVKRAMGGPDLEEPGVSVTVGCLTTDFAMQNVLIQMGLNVLSTDGLLIRHAKSYVMRCFACMKVTTKVELEFCPHCGNKTLQKVSMSVNDDGTIRYYYSKRRPVSVRGLKFSLPKPQGGKHAVNPVLCADQQGAQQRLSKAAKVKYNPFDPDYLANSSPFAPVDVYSRAAQLGIRGSSGHSFQKRRNPNENKKVYGRRK